MAASYIHPHGGIQGKAMLWERAMPATGQVARMAALCPRVRLLKFLNEQSLLQVLLNPIVTRAAAVDDQVV